MGFSASLNIKTTLFLKRQDVFLSDKIRFAKFYPSQKNLAPGGEQMKNSQLIFLMAEIRKLAGRPKMEREKRNKKIDARFTQTEYNLVVAMETALGISKTELVRMRLLNGSEKMLLNSRELVRQMDALGAEMGRIGNNINQLARHANRMNLQGEVPTYIAGQFNELFEQYLGSQQRLEVVFRTLIRLAGK